MPYINGRRVSMQEWQDTYSSLKKLHTGPGGENPAEAPAIDPDTGAPKSQPTRSPRSAAGAKAAVADALGVSEDSEEVESLDFTGMDADSDDGADATDDGDGSDTDAGDAPADAEANADEFACDQCDMVAKSALGLASHKRAKHKE